MRALPRRAALVLAPGLLLAAGSAGAVAAQSRVVGRVVDAERRPLVEVEVLIDRREVRASTNANGVFAVPVGKGDSTIAFRRIGYHPLVLRLVPLPAPTDTILVELGRATTTLPDLTVSTTAFKPLRYAGTTKYDEVLQRQRLGLGTILTREELDRKTAILTPEFLQGIPGVAVTLGVPGSRTTSIRFARCRDPSGVAVFIDGVRLIPVADPTEEPAVEMLTRISPAEIEMVEVYRGASQIPGVYHWNGCAVVALWTRWNR